MDILIEIVQFIDRNGWIGVLATVLGIAVTLALTRTHKRPYFRYSLQTVISESSTRLSDLQVLFRGVPVDNLQRIRLLFWNGGRAPIRSQDVPEGDPIAFSISGDANVLSAAIVATTRESIGATLQHNKKTLWLNFDNLDHGDGLLVELFCVGDAGSIEAGGKIIGAKTIDRKSGQYMSLMERDNYYNISFDRPDGYVFLLLGVTIFVLLAVMIADMLSKAGENPPGNWIALSFALLLFAGAGHQILSEYMRAPHRLLKRNNVISPKSGGGLEIDNIS